MLNSKIIWRSASDTGPRARVKIYLEIRRCEGLRIEHEGASCHTEISCGVFIIILRYPGFLALSDSSLSEDPRQSNMSVNRV
jgi:hypothetical protein